MAFQEITESLPLRAATVLDGLRRYRRHHGIDPTSYELLRFLQHDDPALDLNGVRPRLTELRDADEAHTTGKRPCAVTGKSAYTWAPGPGPTMPLFLHSRTPPIQEELF